MSIKVKGVSFAELKAKAFRDPEVLEAYLAEQRKDELKALLAQMRKSAGMNSAQVAAKMGVTPATVSKLENRADKASLGTLDRYASACGASIQISIQQTIHI
ncbi:helix-turn-helix transcriptional regulator [Shewanella sp. SNU WT4]|uniref:helix-turn-helix domain-containing protein n=1 Tax=Shewanella sp. SNU WT4 TaxID=2590015 RepID=UPI001F1061ED|nr:helix-turn-helix transcriptional regulator [Shewanella sp. SNU WT4]